MSDNVQYQIIFVSALEITIFKVLQLILLGM